MNVYNTKLSELNFQYIVSSDSTIKKVDIFSRWNKVNIHSNNSELFAKLRDSIESGAEKLSPDSLQVLRDNLEVMTDKGVLTSPQKTKLECLIRKAIGSANTDQNNNQNIL